MRGIVDPLMDLFCDERTDSMQFRERPILHDKLDNIFRPKKGAARSAAKRSRENSGIALRLTREKFRDIIVAQPGCATPHPILLGAFAVKVQLMATGQVDDAGSSRVFLNCKAAGEPRRFYFLVFEDLRVRRFDEFGAIHRKRLVQDLRKVLRKNDGDGLRVTCINGDRKRSGVAIIPVDRPIGLPNAISMAGGVIGVTNEKNFRPEIFLQAVLGFDGGKIIAGGDNAAVEHNQVGFTRGKDDRLLGAGAKRKTGEENSGMIGKFAK